MPEPVVEPAESDELTPSALAELLRGSRPRLIDVREPWEAAIASIAGSELIPLGLLGRSVEQMDRDEPIVLYCHHGARSAHALELLRRNGFTRATHLAGGIDAFAAQVDPSLVRY